MSSKEKKMLREIALGKAVQSLSWKGWCEDCECDCCECVDASDLADEMLEFCLKMNYSEKEKENLYKAVEYELLTLR